MPTSDTTPAHVPTEPRWAGLPARRVLIVIVAALALVEVLGYVGQKAFNHFDSRTQYEQSFDAWAEGAADFIGESHHAYIHLRGAPVRGMVREDGGRILEYESFLIGDGSRFVPHAYEVHVGPDTRVERIVPQ